MSVRRLGLLTAALCLLGATPQTAVPRLAGDPPVLVTVAETDSQRARLWLRARGEVARVMLAPASGGARRVLVAHPDPARDHTAVVALDGLRPGERYAYEVESGGVHVDGTFTVAPERDADRPVRLLWSGDLGGAGHCRDAREGYPIFRAMTARDPDLFLFVGDTIYADHACGGMGAVDTLAGFRAKHRYNRADRALQQFFRTTSVFAVWDDHEVRNNFVGPEEPLMPLGRRAFLDYFPVLGPPEEPERLYRAVRWGQHVEIFILDTRQYRSSNAAPDGPDKTMLGAAQRRWLLDAAAASDATWKLVVSSVPLGIFTGGRTADSWSSANVLGFPRNGSGGFAHERDFILDELRARGVRNVVFVSGDVHHAELIRHHPRPDYVVHELIAGPLSARQGYPRFLDRSLNSRSLASLGLALNFGEIVADATTLTARILDVSGTVRAQTTIPAHPVSQTAQSTPDRGQPTPSAATHNPDEPTPSAATHHQDEPTPGAATHHQDESTQGAAPHAAATHHQDEPTQGAAPHAAATHHQDESTDCAATHHQVESARGAATHHQVESTHGAATHHPDQPTHVSSRAHALATKETANDRPDAADGRDRREDRAGEGARARHAHDGDGGG